MIKSFAALIVLSLVLLAGQFDKLQLSSPFGQPTDVPVVEAPVCRNRDPHEYVYHPTRLTLVAPCAQLSGIIRAIRVEPDGDYHVLLEPDPQFANLVNGANQKLQRGWLVMEPVCMKVPEEEAAKEACGSYLNPLVLPAVGTHVVVIGPYVLDTEHSNWAEIHPLWQILPQL